MYKEYNIAKDLVYDTCYWGIIVALGVIIAIISINIRSCNVDRYDSHLEWYRR